jgi:hypothetical protein
MHSRGVGSCLDFGFMGDSVSAADSFFFDSLGIEFHSLEPVVIRAQAFQMLQIFFVNIASNILASKDGAIEVGDSGPELTNRIDQVG